MDILFKYIKISTLVDGKKFNYSPIMDKINKFISLRPSRSHAFITHKNKSYKITKPDLLKLHKYKTNQPLTSIDLYIPLNTKWSSNTQNTPLKKPVKKFLNPRKFDDFVERVRNFVPKELINNNEIINLWEPKIDANFSHKIEFNKIVECGVSDYALKNENEAVKGLLNDLHTLYFEPEKNKIRIQDLLPTIRDNRLLEGCVNDVGLYYRFGEAINGFDVDNTQQYFCVYFKKSIEVFEFTNKRKIYEHKFENSVVKARIVGKSLYVAYGQICEIIRFDDEENKIEEVTNGSVNIKKSAKSIIISHPSKIIDFDFYNQYVTIISGKRIYLHEVESSCSRLIKIKSEQPLNIRFGYKKREISITTSNGLHIYDINTKTFVTKNITELSYVHSISISKRFTLLSDKETRIVLLNETEIKKQLEQNRSVKNVVARRNGNQFIVHFRDEIVFLECEPENNFNCQIVNRIKDRFKMLMYHHNLNLVYAVKGNLLCVLT